MKKEKHTIEEIKKIKGFENFTHELALELIDTLYKFSLITYKIYLAQLKSEENNILFKKNV